MEGLRKNFQIVLFAGILQAIAGAINAFIVPKYLGIEEFSLIREFLLYASYIGVLHLGFVDGILVKYAGRNIDDLSKIEIVNEFKFLFYFQGLIALLVIVTGIIFLKINIVLFGFCIIVCNLYLHISNIFLSIGKLTHYVFLRTLPIFILMFNLILILLGIKQSVYFNCAFFISNLIGLGYFFYFFKKYFLIASFWAFPIDQKNIKNVFKVGSFVLIGNFLCLTFFSMDRWTVYLFFKHSDFGIYSFALSVLQIIQVLVLSISVTFYPYLAKEESRQNILKYSKLLLILGTFSMIFSFILCATVNLIIKDFSSANSLINILFLGSPALIISNSIYINLLKTKNNVKEYLLIFIFSVLISILANGLCIIFFKDIISIGICNILIYFVFMAVAAYRMPYARLERSDILYLVLCLCVYIFVRIFESIWLGGGLYLLGICILTLIFYRSILSDYSQLFSITVRNFLKNVPGILVLFGLINR